MATHEAMKLVSVNIAPLRAIPHGGNPVMTGIFKEPVTGRIPMQTLGLAGDNQADLQNHGGIHKAVYSYPVEHYEFWSRELGRNDFVFGQFGENLTVSGLSEDDVHIGDMFRVGNALLEVTQPRVPCFKLALKMNVPDFVKRFTQSGRTGFYQRVLVEGEVGAGDSIERVKTDPRRVTVRQMMQLKHIPPPDFSIMEKAVNIPALTPGWRDDFKGRLETRNSVSG
jgi:MOSC domain-containing protein YiiM